MLLGFSMVVLYRYMEPRLEAKLQEQLDSAPKTPEGRVEKWLIFGHPQIDTCIELLRMSEEQPWIVSHVIAQDSGPPRVFGLDLEKLEDPYLRRVGTRIEIWLPEPGELGRTKLIGRNAGEVPVYEEGQEYPILQERIRDMIEWRLHTVVERLQSDIPEVEVRLEFGPVPREEDSRG